LKSGSEIRAALVFDIHLIFERFSATPQTPAELDGQLRAKLCETFHPVNQKRGTHDVNAT
jgi:hypothetical protein